ncbi:MAG: xanthine dehydrogenase family protein molybdopterin-binding subunit [Candidatus Hydrogenedentes bacterium]|nr:xanthine dehydrogenase family protein molybdopterin-binding subunit [Candidatus Hydrogenedentota bacterium]
MNRELEAIEPERYELAEPPRYVFSLSRRAFVQSVGAGLLITAIADGGFAQERGGRGEQNRPAAGRFHVDKAGRITAFTGKVEVGQGARTQLTMAAAEELHVPLSAIALVMADTSIVPNDGITAGSRTTPSTVPAMRKAAAAARELLLELACRKWNVSTDGAAMRDGTIEHSSGKKLTLAELVADAGDIDAALRERSSSDATLAAPDAWTILGKTTPRINAADVVTGKHRYTSDMKRPGMLYGGVLRPPSYGAELVEVDLKAVENMDGIIAVRDGAFVGVAAPTSYDAQKAITALASTAKWSEAPPQPSSEELFAHLKASVREGSGRQRSREDAAGDVDAALSTARNVLRAEYHIPYIQHAPMETRAAVAEFEGDDLTVWTGTQNPFGVVGDVAEALGMPPGNVRVIVPDTGGGFGGKHQGDAAVEAARLAKAAKRPVSLQWTRKEEFTWAYFRPAGVIEIAAVLDEAGKLLAWDFTNYNSGTSGIACPYATPNERTRFRNTDSPLRQGSYRALGSTANNFAREAFIDELAAAAKTDPLTFRQELLEEPRLKAVLNAAAEKFDFANRRKNAAKNTGYGIACGTEKGSFVASCAEVTVNPATNEYAIGRTCTAFECGAIHNPQNLQAQVEGCVVMGLGAVLREAMVFEGGKIANPHFTQYEVPRFSDVPEHEIILLNRPDLPSAGAGETPIIAIAPAIANAIFQAAGKPLHALPLKLA